MFITRKRYERDIKNAKYEMQESINDVLNKLRGEIRTIKNENEIIIKLNQASRFVSLSAMVLNPYETISVKDAVVMLAEHLGLKFTHKEGTKQKTVIEEIKPAQE